MSKLSIDSLDRVIVGSYEYIKFFCLQYKLVNPGRIN